jgi:hypothetical protein
LVKATLSTGEPIRDDRVNQKLERVLTSSAVRLFALACSNLTQVARSISSSGNKHERPDRADMAVFQIGFVKKNILCGRWILLEMNAYNLGCFTAIERQYC